MAIPSQIEPVQSCFDERDCRAVEEIVSRMSAASRNLNPTITPTTLEALYVCVNDWAAFNACFIQTKVPPHKSVTNKSAIPACRRPTIICRCHH